MTDKVSVGRSEEREVVYHMNSCFVLGRSGTGYALTNSSII